MITIAKEDIMLKVTICKGLPASGKSTWAKEQVAKSGGKLKRINKDDLRAMVDPNWTTNKEKFIVQIRDAFIKEALLEGFNVIVDDTNLAGTHIEDITQLAQLMESQIDDKIEVIINDSFLQVPIPECIERDRKRGSKGGKVGYKTILRMAKGAGLIESDHLPENLWTCDATRYWKEWDPKLPNCIICDLDGTLSIMHNNRSPFEAEKSDTDLLNEPVAQILKDTAKQFRKSDGEPEIKILLFSGRSDAGRKQTEEWLDDYKIPYDLLVMRKDGDYQGDGTLKESMYKEHVEGKYNVRFVLDDRNVVVDKWRELGLLCLQVYYGDF
jgi:predicted kinase